MSDARSRKARRAVFAVGQLVLAAFAHGGSFSAATLVGMVWAGVLDGTWALAFIAVENVLASSPCKILTSLAARLRRVDAAVYPHGAIGLFTWRHARQDRAADAELLRHP